MAKRFRLVISHNADGDYLAVLYQRILWFFWMPVSGDTAFNPETSGDFFLKYFKANVKKWINFHKDNLEIINKTDLDLS